MHWEKYEQLLFNCNRLFYNTIEIRNNSDESGKFKREIFKKGKLFHSSFQFNIYFIFQKKKDLKEEIKIYFI